MQQTSTKRPRSTLRNEKPALILLRQTVEYSSEAVRSSPMDGCCIICCVSSRHGWFVTFEGLDGCGKSTQLLLDTRTLGLSPIAELALMFASRAQHIEEIITPALTADQIVLCDRFTDSSEAYQGGGRKLGSKIVLDLHRALCSDLRPDLTILMDSDV